MEHIPHYRLSREAVYTRLFEHMTYGGDYYPEQWPEEVWQEDVRLMREAGVNLVSLGIFAWARLEPQPGQYDFDWLDRIMDLLHAYDIRVNLATATASPPPWLAKHHPESLPVTHDGTRLWPGSRQHYCPSNQAYRTAAQALVQRLAERYRHHPALVLWHVGNEYGCHVSACYCDESAAAFRRWLQQRYTTLDALNRAWGTAFWSQQYGDWEEILPPRRTPTFSNPSQQLDWHRFCSDALLECFEMECAILREYTPHIPITTNFMHAFKPLNYWKWAAREDLVALDMYPDPAEADAHVYAALNYDLMRSLGQGRPWLLMEQATSQVNWRPYNFVKQPGQMRLWSHQAIARGSQGVMFFQWRQSCAGAEKFHSAMVPHVGTNSRIWREVVALGQELRRLDILLPSRIQAKVAIMWDWESWWALELEGKPSCSLRQIDQVRAFYEPLFARNITVDFVPPDGDLQSYRVVLIPNLYLVRETTAQRLADYVAGGGTVVIGFFSGIVDEHDHVWLGGYPAPFRRMLGVRIEEFIALPPQQHIGIITDDGNSYNAMLWSEVLELEGAIALAQYTTGFYAGYPAVTQNRFGQGIAYYLSTQLEAAGMSWLVQHVCDYAGVQPVYSTPPGVEAIVRQDGQRTWLYLLNHRATSIDVALNAPADDLLSGQRLATICHLEPYGVAILTPSHSSLTDSF
ncbi:beta-galactosidase [Kallotenue papyrolyticum]|uniref:beta-galactosidase n=1 Tax=Kallotenue papyrolyticum TaxID=1325125 RepID=UPI00047863EC|nr:beta-galactosidase [Kallotenue papyrolyticum]